MDEMERAEETLPGVDPTVTPSGSSEQPLLQLAESYLRAGVFSGKALRIFSDVLKSAPDRADFQKAYEICLLLQNVAERMRARLGEGPEPGEAKENPREAVERLFGQFSGSPDLAKCLGDVRLLDGDWEGATHAYRLAQSKGYRDDQAIVNSGRLALRRDGCPVPVYRYFGELALALGQYTQAVAFLVKTLQALAGDAEASVALMGFLTERLLPRLESMTDRQTLLAAVVRVCLRMQLMERALEAFRQLEIDGVLHADLVKQIAQYLIQQEDYRQAFDYLSRLPFDRETKALVNEITLRLEQRGELDTAVYLLQYMNRHDLVIQEAQKMAQDRLEETALRELADLCFRSGRYDAALSHYLTLVRRNAAGLTEFADRIETAAIQTAKPQHDELLFLGEFFYHRRDWRRAESLLNRVLELDVTNMRARELLRSIYDAMLKAEPNLGRVRLKSGDLWLTGGRVDEAIEEYKRVLESPGYEMEARRRLATAFMQIGEHAPALDQYRRLPLKTLDLEILYPLHERLVQENEYALALEALRLVQQFDPHYRDVTERVTHVEQLQRQQDDSPGLRDPKMIELIGEQAVGRYRYIEQVGSGGMGVVHKVYDLKSKCMVAMKILKDSLTGSSKAIDRFFREARIAATLSHPNIVNIFDYNINNVFGKSYISMEYVDGPSLRDLIEQRFTTTAALAPETIAEVLYYVAQLCDALEATHLKGIIHRDIKPDNIMITSKRVVKITDFGIVHIEEATFTPTGALIGTPRYMSPEQVRGGRVDCRSDIYAVGIILYESLIGTPPFISGDIAYQQVNVAPTPPREVNATVPPDVEAIILRCLEKDPRSRYQRARELKQAIEDVLQALYAPLLDEFRQTPFDFTSTLDAPRQVTE